MAALAVAAFIIAVSSVVVLVQMGAHVRQQIDAVATANSDSTQWSLAQLDVELLALKAAIAEARTGDGDVRATDDVRRRFDVLYSRVRTLSTSPLYAPLRDEPDAAEALSRIAGYLEAAIPLIDLDDAGLSAAFPVLADRTEAIRPVVRTVTLEGVAILARQADAQRRGIAETLYWVSTLTAGLFLILLVLLALLLHFANRSRQRAREESLIRSRLASIISTSLDAVVVVDRQGRILDFNGAAEKIFGYTRDEAIGAPMADLMVPDHMRQAHEAGMNRYLVTGEKRVIGKGRVQLEARRKSGELFPIEISISTAESEAGEIYVSFARDISHRVAAERELIQARDEAVAGERAKADLIAVMSHEMRTPLNGMLGTLDLLDTDARTRREAEYLEIIRASGRQLLHHVDNVLEISRAEAGKISVNNDPFALRSLLRELVESQRSVAEHRGNTLELAIGAIGDEIVSGDASRLRQVLLNLIGNAIKFTRNGSIRVEADRIDGGDILEFRVRDTGIGIDPADHDRVFQDFVTLDTSYSRSVGGTGLGLAIVRRIVTAMGGEVSLESRRGEGSLFRVRLPLPGTDRVSPAPRNDPAAADRGARPAPLKILIVEDNRINRVVLRDLLEEDGHVVDEAHDGQQGVAAVARGGYDLVLMDISMPVMDGCAAARAIRAAEMPGHRLPMVAVTAHALPADRRRFEEAGLDDVLIKPISREAVRALLARVAAAGAADQRAGADETALLVDRAQIDDLARSLGAARFGALLGDFIAETDAAVAAIAAAIEVGQTGGELCNRIHQTAGSAAMFGTAALRALLARLESRLKEGQPPVAGDAAVLRDMWKQTTQALQGVS